MIPCEGLYDAEVKVLAESIAHHVEVEASALFPKRRDSHIDLDGRREMMNARRQDLLDC